MKILDASSLQDTMEQRAKHYDKLRDQFTALRKAFQEIIDLDDFEGRGAEAIKAFYQGQIEVVEAWQRLFDRQIAFFESVGGKLSDKDLDGNTRVETAFLEEDLVQKERQADEMITEQRRALENIFRDIDDLVSLDAFSRDKFDDLMMDASKKRTKTIEAVEDTDQELKEEYLTSEGEEAYAIQLFSALLGATKQGSSISPIHFDADAYQASDIYKLKGEAEAATLSYITYKKEEQQAREIAEQPTSEKVWGGIKSFVGEFTGYYDYKRAVEGVDPVTGEKMSTAQRLAAGGMALAGFIPVVGWAGRAVKGGKGIYSAAKGISAAENAMSTYKNVKAFSTLEKTEMGIYGLLSANGLSEYVTGKDMFGNELTDQQRQASLTQSIFAGLPFVPGMAKEANRLGQQALSSTVQIGKQGADVSRAFMDDLGRSLNTSPNAAFAGGVGNMNSYLKAESRADVGKVSGDKREYLSMLSGRGAVKETGQSTQEEVKKKMLPSEGDIGTYKDLNDAGQVGDDITPHHMPSKEYLVKKLGWDRKEAKNDGMSINVEQPKTGGRHRKTQTYGRNMSNDAKEFYYSLEPRSAIAFDINDLRNIYKNDGLYKEMLPNLRRYVQEAKEDYYKNYLIKKE
ncbi:ribonuclease YeeF family protein [Bacillus sp. Au-Bac7]|uniref:ribonuclease YeeF family protein n=1 Tax=Bacillus sp. Au-Bac7 TaxID=2906458 RepID=UPI001E4AA90D|nr:T7SS effector LXG polymorphic toxin [Bacillus sp. Au-Bac7]MCE4049582.1 pre-toxin TG domain-containing protein [Bacillus sp. Au-Bac7]